MSRVIAGLVALSLVPASVAAQTTQTFAIQAPDGDVGFGTVQVQGVPAPPPPRPNQGPSRDLAPPRTGTSRIRGRVVAADSGQPARRATIRLTGGDMREPRSTVTDAEGRYEFRDLPSGRYSLSASKSTYVTISYGQTRPMEPGRPIEVGENQTIEKIDFNLPRGGVISGRIVDEYGEPIANAVVQPMQSRFMNGQQRPMPSGNTATTSDTGEYRLWGLSPGQYFVSVNPRAMGMTTDTTDDRSGYASTYYPGTANLIEAQLVTVATGQVASGFDIMLTPVRTATVSGVAMDSKGQPLRSGMVMAMQRSPSGMFGSTGGQIRPDGTFTVSGLAPGEYMLRGNIPQSRPGEPSETVVATVTVSGGDITGVVLTPIQPAIVKGRIIFDPPAPALQPSMVRVMASPRNPEPMMPPPVVTGPPLINDDFTFELKAAPGRMVVRAAMMGAPPSSPNPWTLKSVHYDTTDITDTGIDLGAGRDVSGVEIVMTNRAQIVTGRVTSSRGETLKEATVVFFAQDRERRIGPTRYTGMGRLDQTGKYTTRGLPPGDYFAVAVERVDTQRYPGDPEYLEQLSQGAFRFTLHEGETRALDLQLTMPR